MITRDRPKRAYEIDIHIGADDWDSLLADLDYLVDHVRECGPTCGSVMGGPHVGHVVNVVVTPEQSHERYMEQLDAYLAERDGQKERGA